MGGNAGNAPGSFSVLASRLRALRIQAGQPSFTEIARRISAARQARGVPEHESRVSRITVYDCFRDERKRVDSDLVMEIVRTLEPDLANVAQWSADLDAFQRRIAAAAVVTVTDNLPQPLPGFVGREAEIAQILAADATWISGMPGSGKTQLALKVGNKLVDSGAVESVLLSDLRGFSPEGPPADPQAVADGLLRILGINDRNSSASNRLKQLRRELLSRKILVIFDDAAHPEQLHAILPDLTGIRVLITSRIVPEFADADPTLSHIQLPLFSRQESHDALATFAKKPHLNRLTTHQLTEDGHSTDDDATAIEALLDTTGDLPLAVRLTASRIAANPEWTLAEHLEFATTRQQSLRLDDSLYQSFSLSYSSLDPDSQSLLRLLAVHPESLLDRASALGLAQGIIPNPQACLSRLVQANLLTEPRDHRYAMHELVRVHAADLSMETDPPSWRNAARSRLIASLVVRAWEAQRIMKEAVQEVPRQPRFTLDPEHLAAIDFTPEQADEFFADSADLILTMALNPSESDVKNGDDEALITTASEAMMSWLHRVGRFDDSRILHEEALRQATRRGDLEGEVRAQVSLGSTLAQMGRNSDAYKVLIAVDGIARDFPIEDLLLQNSLGVVLSLTDNDAEAEERYHNCLTLAQELGDVRRIGFTWNNLGKIYMVSGRLEQCREALERSIDIAERTNDATSIARTKINLASLLIDMEQYADALQVALESYDHSQEANLVPGIAVSCLNVAAALMKLDRHAEATQWNERGIQWTKKTGMEQHQVTLEGNLATCLRIAGEHARAGEVAFAAVARCLAVEDPQLSKWSAEVLSENLTDTSRIPRDHPQWADIASLLRSVDTEEAAKVHDVLFSS